MPQKSGKGRECSVKFGVNPYTASEIINLTDGEPPTDDVHILIQAQPINNCEIVTRQAKRIYPCDARLTKTSNL